ncbi:HalOD1 output domain-containing protein [Natronococcus amylolyticus]|uniref:HalOD1 output domain-containing protein n=1 Tax=Natronococcus amylolyticus TaxID=44470 RepID=UPI000677CE5D
MESHPISIRVVEQVAERSNKDPIELPPLHSYVNVDALDALFRSSQLDIQNSAQIEFQYTGYDVTILFEEFAEISISESD